MSSIKNKDRTSKGYIIDEMHRWNVLLETREIFLHGFIDNTEYDPGVEYRMANIFLKNITLLERIDSKKPIIIHHHSIGGEWCEGMMMFDAIRQCNAPTVSITHGMAASMGSLVPLAADMVVSMPSCWWMIHDGYTDIEGHTYKQSRSWTEWEKVTRNQMMDIYAESCIDAVIHEGKTEKQLINIIQKQLDQKEDWWLCPNDAKEFGFINGIYGIDYGSLDEVLEYVS